MKVKAPIFVFSAVTAAVTVAQSQTPVAVQAAAPVVVAASAPAARVAAPAVETDEIELESGGGKVELKVSGQDFGEQLVDIVCEDATLADILRQFRRTVRANIISTDSTNLNRRVSISLHDAPWFDSLQAVLNLGGFALETRNGIFFVEEEHAVDPVKTKSFPLNHANADELSKLLNDSFGVRDKTGKIVANVATVFKDANVIVVSAREKTLRDCEAIIKSVDSAPAQVYIEARFIAISSEALHNLGIQWDSLKNYQVSLRNLQAGYEGNRGNPNNFGEHVTQRTSNNTLSDNSNFSSSTDADGKSTSSTTSTRNGNQNDNTTFSSLVPTAIGEATRAGASAASMAWKEALTFSGQLTADDFSLALSAFESMSDVKIFSNPRIIVSNGKEAMVDMTTKYPNVTVQASRSGGYNDALDISTRIETIPGEDKHMFAKEAFFSWGISLSVTPRISPDGLINVEIVPTISDRSDWAEVEGNGANDAVYTKYPVIDIKRLVTDFTMKDGATAVIGGLTRTKEQDVDTGIPYLRKIPWIGPRLFGWKGRQKVQEEIIVFVTVGIANPRALRQDVGLPKNAIFGREFVEGRAFEPGDRGGVGKAMTLDMRTVEERFESDGQGPQQTQKASPAPVEETPAVEPVAPAVNVPAPSPAATESPVESVHAKNSPTIEISNRSPRVVQVEPQALRAEKPALPSEDDLAVSGPRKTLRPPVQPTSSKVVQSEAAEPKIRHGRLH